LSHAHFIYVYSHDGKAKVVFGEDLEPDQAKFLAGLSSMKAYKIENGKRVPIELTQKTEDGTGWFETSLSASEHMVDVHCPYGVFGRGDKKMLLDYSAKYINLNAGKPAIADSLLPLDLIPIMKNGRLEVTGYFDGKPSENIEIEVTRMAGESIAKTNASGQAVLNLDARYVVRGKFSVGETGELNGKTFTEKRYYCTLVIDTEPLQQKSADLTTATKTSLKKVDAKLADFPKGMTSFGATVVGNQIFVVGGKSGRAHHYARSFQNRDVFCLPVDGSQKKWRSVGENLGLQGLSIVGHKGKVYRIGGLEAKNKEGDEQDLHSTASFVEFDPATKTWRKLPDLPEGRSSIDACVAGNNIFVAGGWNMGEGKPRWATKMLRFDLSKPHGSWQQIESPFKSRAMALRHHNGKLFAIGGIQQAGGPTNKVHIYDLATDEWSNGPAIPTSGPMKAFGCSAVSINGQLLVSTYDGGIFALSNDGKDWAKVHELDAGRFFHQMLPITDNRFALVGGSHMETGSHLEVEVFEVTENMTDASTK
jgi:N-acetylneuraminic acid mutarotase